MKVNEEITQFLSVTDDAVMHEMCHGCHSNVRKGDKTLRINVDKIFKLNQDIILCSKCVSAANSKLS